MNRFLLSILAAVLLHATAGTAEADATIQHRGAARYDAREITRPADAACLPGFFTRVYARRLNERAQVTGYYNCYEATGDPEAPYYFRGERAFRWSRWSGSLELQPLAGSPFETYGRDINEYGTVVGWDTREDAYLAAIWPFAGGVAEAIPATPCPDDPLVLTRAEGINDRGAIAGSSTRVDIDGVCNLHWILKLPNGSEIVGSPTGGSVFSINNRNIMVGSSKGSAMKWSPAIGEVSLASNGGVTAVRPFAWSINDDNEVVGYIERLSADFSCVERSDAKYWSANGTERALPALPGSVYGVAFGINDESVVVGYVKLGPACDPYDPRKSRAVVWNARRVTDLNTLISGAMAHRILLTSAQSINDQGEIVARGIRLDEPRRKCPDYAFDPVTETIYYDSTLMCQSEYGFLLTPENNH